ncbi:hypothetical protein [Rhodococcus opacus]|nr:hypothetical protein [Rhodococcus opacus]
MAQPPVKRAMANSAANTVAHPVAPAITITPPTTPADEYPRDPLSRRHV